MQVRNEDRYRGFLKTIRTIWKVRINSWSHRIVTKLHHSKGVRLDSLMVRLLGCHGKFSAPPLDGLCMKDFWCFSSLRSIVIECRKVLTQSRLVTRLFSVPFPTTVHCAASSWVPVELQDPPKHLQHPPELYGCHILSESQHAGDLLASKPDVRWYYKQKSDKHDLKIKSTTRILTFSMNLPMPVMVKARPPKICVASIITEYLTIKTKHGNKRWWRTFCSFSATTRNISRWHLNWFKVT